MRDVRFNIFILSISRNEIVKSKKGTKNGKNKSNKMGI